MKNVKKDYIVSFALFDDKILFKDDDREVTKIVEDLLNEWTLNEDFNIESFKIDGHTYRESPNEKYCDVFHIIVVYKNGIEAPLCIFVEEVPKFCPCFNYKKKLNYI